MPDVAEQDIIKFTTAVEWELWLGKNYNSCKAIWLKIGKKGGAFSTVSYDQALDIALCFGWIDGQKKTYDADCFIQKFTPRRPKSSWSKRNVGKVAELIKAKKMRPSGLAEVTQAQTDGRWDAAYDSPKNMQIPQDFLQELAKHKNAHNFFASLNKTSLFTIGYKLQSAKTEKTRTKRITDIIAQLNRGEKPKL